MKKEYITPNMRVKEMAARKMLCGSPTNFTINSNTNTSSQFSRDMDVDEEDW